MSFLSLPFLKMRAIERVILCGTRKIGPKDEHFRILIFALWVLQATAYGVPWLQNAVLGKSFASQRCCLKSPIRVLPEVPSKNFGRRALVQFGRSPRTRCSKRLLGCVVWISAMTAQLPPHSHRRACEAATLQTKIIAFVTAQLIGLHADCLVPVC